MRREVWQALAFGLPVIHMTIRTTMGAPSFMFVRLANSGESNRVVVVAVLLGILASRIAEAQKAAGINVSIGLCKNLVRPWGYPCNEYTVQTDDGFLLGVQNIPNGVSQRPSYQLPRSPVFLQHGLFAGGDNWVFNDPKESLGFILADAGYDVWIGNIRGIIWSHGHVNITTNGAEFWDWSWDELAAYDLPAMLGFVYNQTGSKIMYIGHSQATSMLMAGLVGTAQSQALADMLKGVVLICPIAYMNKIRSNFDRTAADLYTDKIFSIFGIHKFTLHNQLGVQLIQEVCGTLGVNCTSLYRAMTGIAKVNFFSSHIEPTDIQPGLVYDLYVTKYVVNEVVILSARAGNDCCVNNTRLPFYLNFFPQATSSKNLGHFFQMIRKNTFSKYDYGLKGNLLHYRQLTPPVYNLANFPSSLPLMIVQGGEDSLADPQNVEDLVTLLGTKVTKLLSVERYAHGDFLVSTSANVEVYPEIMNFVRNSNSR